MRRYSYIILTLFLINSFLHSQTIQKEADEINTELYYSIAVLSQFIASDYFSKLDITVDELALIDTIYLHALHQMQFDYSEALLLLTFATLPFNEFPFEIPLINIRFGIPLPSATDSVFYGKRENLPKDIFFDSPKTKFGDKDKIAHFFGNAFLAYNIGFFNLSKFLGILVELIEDAFSTGGLVDIRDIKVNYLGELFGSLLNENKNLLPSDVLKIYSIFFYKHSNF